MNPKRLNSLIGLELGGRRLVAVDVRRSGGGRMEVRRRMQAPLSLDPFAAAPELAAREIRNLLTEAGLRPGRCVVCLPLSQVMTHQIQIPAIEEADIPDFLALEAENAFPFAPEDLAIAISRFTDPGGVRWATLLAVSASHLTSLENVLRLAGLRVVSITLGAMALVDTAAGGVDAALVKTEAGVELLVSVAGGLAALRALSGAAGGERDDALDMPALVRDCRITLGRLPRPTRDALRQVRIFGPPDVRRALIRELEPELEPMGIALEPADVSDQALVVRGDSAANPAESTLTAARWMLLGKASVEFLAPRASRLRQTVRRLSSSTGLGRLGLIAASVVLVVGMAFAWQHWRLSSLENRWRAIETQVTDLEGLQKKIRLYRPWYDNEHISSLELLGKLTEAFPERGDVWMRTLAIKNLTQVDCGGNARSRADILHMLDLLAKTPGVEELTQGPMQGNGPVQFSLSYQWKPGVANVK